MKKMIFLLGVVAAIGFISSGAFADPKTSGNKGEAEFKEHCAVCHANGGNIINPKKTLAKKDREANNIKNAGDIIKNILDIFRDGGFYHFVL